MNAIEHVGRFSDGQETLHVTPEHARIGRFSDGQATLDDLLEQASIGRFSTGQELLAETVDHVRVGRFSDHDGSSPSGALRLKPETTDRVAAEKVMS